MTSTVIPFPGPRRTTKIPACRIAVAIVFPRGLTEAELTQIDELIFLERYHEAAELFGGKLTFPKE